MKILQIISSLGNGGAEKFVVELSNELSNTNDVKIVSFKSIEDWMIFPKMLNKCVPLISLDKKQGFDVRTFKKLFKLFKHEKPDVIHFHLDATIKYIIPLTFFFQNTKFIYTIHSNLNSDKITLFNYLERMKFLTTKVKYICISESIYYQFKKKFPSFNFVLIENGIQKMHSSDLLTEIQQEIKKYKSNAETKLFLVIGNYSAPKNFQLITEVFKKLHTTSQNVALLIIGDDVSAEKTEWKKIQNLKSPNTYMLGPKANVQDYLHESNAYCLCSVYEGLPISILEAYSMGKPVLSTPAGGIPSILKNQVNGLLSSDFTIEAYYEMILNFLKIPENHIAKFKKNNLDDFEKHFTISKTTEKYILNYLN